MLAAALFSSNLFSMQKLKKEEESIWSAQINVSHILGSLPGMVKIQNHDGTVQAVVDPEQISTAIHNHLLSTTQLKSIPLTWGVLQKAKDSATSKGKTKPNNQ